MILCNTRNLQSTLTGVQRYTSELLKRRPNNLEVISPNITLTGIRGHIWEQFALPTMLQKRFLWSPSNTGPLTVANQVVSIMDMSPLDHPEWSSRNFSYWYQFLLPRLIRRVKGVITISEFSRQQILNYCPNAYDKIKVTLLAADKRFEPTSHDQIVNSISTLGIPSPYYIVALCSLEPRKNLSTLFNAWRKIQPKLPDNVWLVLAGAKGKASVFGDQFYNELPPNLHLTGHVKDEMLPALYSGALAKVYLSHYEGFGLPPLEAMSCGTAVITSNTSSLPEVVSDAAILVDPRNVDEVAFNILRIVEDSSLRENLRAKGLIQARRFSWDKTASETWEFINEVENR